MLDFFSIRRESSIEKEEGFNSVRREEAAKRLVAMDGHKLSISFGN
jgi:hypothetical protein